MSRRTSAALVLHPESLERAAAAIAAAESELAAVDARLASGELDASGDDPVGPLREAVEIVAAGTGLGLLLAAINVIPPLVVAVGPLGGLVWAGIVLARGQSVPADDDLATFESPLQAERKVAVGRLESAKAAWLSLAGPGADPGDLDAALRRLDAQSDVSAVPTDSSPTVRAVNAVHRRALARWKVAWAALGVDPPPPPEDAERAVLDLRTRLDLRDVVDVEAQLQIS